MRSLQDGLATVNGRQPVDFDVNNTGPYTINRGDSLITPEFLRTFGFRP